MIPESIKTTLKIQPAVILFSSVSILAKLASARLPKGELTLGEKLQAAMSDWRLVGLVALMFLALGTYAVIWQMIIKNAQIAVIYANKSSYLLWAQLAAVFFFGEHITWCNLVGIIIIFAGILLANGSRNEHA
ncbi:MAG: 4-amino-4-deoxy-L-arabinose-phosphoundecaprenol flippase subunit ArnE [Lentisphaerae bacterium ADurb.Bin082]|nr:MAG: 4-amino-4-deoxy-L-arabinose-phosphoundecaprenol flippase subunit ArnE [Lentisphaerae bacterium ADurb.Bin082]